MIIPNMPHPQQVHVYTRVSMVMGFLTLLAIIYTTRLPAKLKETGHMITSMAALYFIAGILAMIISAGILADGGEAIKQLRDLSLYLYLSFLSILVIAGVSFRFGGWPNAGTIRWNLATIGFVGAVACAPLWLIFKIGA